MASPCNDTLTFPIIMCVYRHNINNNTRDSCKIPSSAEVKNDCVRRKTHTTNSLPLAPSWECVHLGLQSQVEWEVAQAARSVSRWGFSLPSLFHLLIFILLSSHSKGFHGKNKNKKEYTWKAQMCFIYLHHLFPFFVAFTHFHGLGSLPTLRSYLL